MADATLLPCPFCGAQPKSQKASDKIHPYRIACCGCGCMTANHGDYRNAWDAWNTRPTQLPSDDGLIRALERLERNFDLLLAGKPVRDVEETKAEVRRALSRHKALLSDCDHFKMVSRDDGPWRCVKCGAIDPPRPKYGSPAPLSVAGDDVGLAERIATIIAFNRNKSNFEIARTILTALQVTEGDEVERLIEARKVVAKEYRRLGLNPNPVLRGDFDAGVEVQAALRSQSNKVSKPL